MKSILYVFVHPTNGISTMTIAVPRVTDVAGTLDAYSPTRLRGYAKKQLEKFVEFGYALSNWHVIDVLPKRGGIASKHYHFAKP